MKIVNSKESDYIIPDERVELDYFNKEFDKTGDTYLNALEESEVYQAELTKLSDVPVLKFPKIYDDDRVNNALLQSVVKTLRKYTNRTSFQLSEECGVVETDNLVDLIK